VAAALDRPAVRAQLEALRLRTTHPAFTGTATHATDGSTALLRWTAGAEVAELELDAAGGRFEVRATVDGVLTTVLADTDLAPAAGA